MQNMQVHDWFATGHASSDADALNERVYAELFLTPSSDPWLGLIPEGNHLPPAEPVV